MKDKTKTAISKAKSLWKTPVEGRYLNLKEMGSFGLYALGNSMMISAINYVTTIAWIPYFYNIDSLHAYIIVLLGSFLNMMILPLLSSIMERTKTKWGKYKPFILFSMPILALFGLLATWIPQYESETSRIIYAYLSCVPVICVSTYANNMYQTMPNVITPNAQERADIMTPIGLIVGLAPSILQIIAGPIRSTFKDQGMEYMGLRIIGIVSVVLSIGCILFILKVKERVYVTEEVQEKVGIGKSLGMVTKNKPLMIMCLALIVGSLREFWRMFMPLMIQFRFAEDAATALDISGLPMTIIGFASTVSMFLLPLVTRKMNKHHAIMIFSVLNVVAIGLLGIMGFQNIPIGTTSAIVLTILMFIAAINPTYLIIPLLLGELADYQQQKTGKRLEGHLQNFLFTMPIVVSNIFMLGTWAWQKEIGFEQRDYKDAEILSEAQQAISNQWFNAVCIISAVSSLLMIIVLFFYPLTKKKHEAILEELRESSHDNGWDISPETVSLNLDDTDALTGIDTDSKEDDTNSVPDGEQEIVDNTEDIIDIKEEDIVQN